MTSMDGYGTATAAKRRTESGFGSTEADKRANVGPLATTLNVGSMRSTAKKPSAGTTRHGGREPVEPDRLDSPTIEDEHARATPMEILELIAGEQKTCVRCTHDGTLVSELNLLLHYGGIEIFDDVVVEHGSQKIGKQLPQKPSRNNPLNQPGISANERFHGA
ncbi:hypothetical protein WN55_01320 [Dufourea novaeangliae]|uniref:Uncharacterized protein n=1 Tax=Dufourea novaeangliae TaxID=178035 RepID=A0A154PCY5_DUFNO|nr:hypothetical protein WN55_01320 [Dufourea novaeangliae]